ncbi:AraC family transcriptional regulator [Hymenobacter sp. BT559]|uniref:helix-turn-helix domain-containing protein n=1 Tax=Hymenobacter sp. BT559 TaxID=2795729 RepID=UPI0018EA5053|nr:helix-turn-helix transcriptional regulator [Hymenobacter sp. BT559]MBJ6142837.1 AraC family transcriptional regulator [Hymenobacter sp. BT559]
MSQKIIPLQSLSTSWAGVAVYHIAPADLTPHVQRELAIAHRHDHYSCFLTEEGAVEITVDFQPLRLVPHSLFVSCPGQVHQVAMPQQYRGWMVLADAKLLSPPTRRYFEQASARPELLHLGAAEHAWFQQLLPALHEAAGPPNSQLADAETSQHLLNAYLAQAVRLLQAQPPQQPAPSRRNLALTQQFRQLLQQHFLSCKKPASYAHQLHVSVNHLNDTVKATTGFSVSYFIQQQVLAEAQRLLVYTDLNVQEVAGQLGYDDTKYFSRLFAKGTGVSPSLFRQRQAPQAT